MILNTPVVNLSKHVLTHSELDILSKGLNFIPCTNSTHFPLALARDLKVFQRRMLLYKYFEDEGADTPEPFCAKNDEWTPKMEILDPEINKVFKECFERLQHFHTYPSFHNISIAERLAINSLRDNRSIVINVADKGSNVVVQSTVDYKTEIYRQLQMAQHYERLDEPLYPTTAIKLAKVLSKLKRLQFISPKQYAYLAPPPNPRPRRLYTIPKIHKPPQDWPFPYCIPPGRPIVSDINSESYHIAEYINHFLQPLASAQTSYIKDSFHFLTLIKDFGKVSCQTLLVTLDVDSMYTNIDNTEGLKSLRRIFDSHPHPSRPDALLLDLIRISLFYNDFLFDGSFWLQKSGTAMGKIFAPSYANLYMSIIEQDFLQTRPIQPLFYKRYLDDLFLLWSDGLPSLLEFITAFNCHCPSIKFKHVIDPLSIVFLDLTIFKHTPQAPSTLLYTKVHFKTTNTLQLLHKHSFHPTHTFAGIVRAQLTRYFRLCTNLSDFHQTVSVLFKALRRQNYSSRFLSTIKQHFMRDLPQRTSSTQLPKPPSTRSILPFVYTWHLGSNFVTSEFLSRLNQLDSPDLRDCRILKAHRRNKNIADLVVRNKL